MITKNYLEYKIYQRPVSTLSKRRLIEDTDKLEYVNKLDYLCTYRGLYDSPVKDVFEHIIAILDSIYTEFNIHHPDSFGSYSLSVGDVVQLEDKFYICSPIGWNEIIFKEEK